MKIRQIEVFLVNIPLNFERKMAHGFKRELPEIFIRIDTDEKISGWGETGGDFSFSGEGQKDIAEVIKNFLGPDLIGKNPFELNAIFHHFNTWFPGNNFAKTGIDFALYDLIGNATQQPVYNLLGGKYNQQIPVGWSLFFRDSTKELIDEALMVKEKGFKAVKLKIGSKDPSKDLANLRELRKHLGDDFPIRVDANEGYSFIEALKILKFMEEFNIQLIEQPVNRNHHTALRQLRQKLSTPIMVDESLFNFNDALTLIHNDAADIFNIKPQRVGGIYEAQIIAKIALAENVPCFASGKMSTSLGSAACAHYAITLPNLIYQGEFAVGVDFVRVDPVLEPLKIENGFINLDNQPGFGIIVDEQYLRNNSTDTFLIK